MRVQAGRDVVWDVLEKHFPKAPQQNRGESYRAVVTRLDTTDFLGTGMMVAVLRRDI